MKDVQIEPAVVWMRNMIALPFELRFIRWLAAIHFRV